MHSLVLEMSLDKDEQKENTESFYNICWYSMSSPCNEPFYEKTNKTLSPELNTITAREDAECHKSVLSYMCTCILPSEWWCGLRCGSCSLRCLCIICRHILLFWGAIFGRSASTDTTMPPEERQTCLNFICSKHGDSHICINYTKGKRSNVFPLAENGLFKIKWDSYSSRKYVYLIKCT